MIDSAGGVVVFRRSGGPDHRFLSAYPHPGFSVPFHYHQDMELNLYHPGKWAEDRRRGGASFSARGPVILGSMLPMSGSAIPMHGNRGLHSPVRWCPAAKTSPFATGNARPLFSSLKRGKRSGVGRRKTAGFGRPVEAILELSSPARRLLGFLDLLFTLAGAVPGTPICGDFPRGLTGTSREQRVGFALRYLQDHFCGDVTQARWRSGSAWRYPPSVAFFRRATGQTFQALLLDLRLEPPAAS